jgi:hypothetical protein
MNEKRAWSLKSSKASEQGNNMEIDLHGPEEVVMEFLTVGFIFSFAVFVLVALIPVIVLGAVPVVLFLSLAKTDISLPSYHHHQPIAQH